MGKLEGKPEGKSKRKRKTKKGLGTLAHFNPPICDKEVLCGTCDVPSSSEPIYTQVASFRL